MTVLSANTLEREKALADPSRDIRTGAIVAGLFFVLFLGWAAFARLDVAAYAMGNLVVSGERQSVQHREGGVIGSISVKEGQRVVRGEVLLRLAAADVEAQERALSSQAIRLLAQRARLEAEQRGLPKLTVPPELNVFPERDRDEARLALRLQQRELEVRRATLSAQRGALGQRGAQSGQQGRGYSIQSASAREQLRIIDEQIRALKPVADRGFVSQTRMRELERLRAELVGQEGQFTASVAQAREAARESELQSLEADRTYRERTASELREVDIRLSEVMPRLVAARDQLARTVIRSPATGAVVGLSVFTPTGVIAPGQKLMDIVPERAPLLINARIAVDDADDLKLAQRTLVKFGALHERSLPDLEGELTRLSADALTDERTGITYYSAEITVPRKQLDLIRGLRGSDFELRAGMPVEILIPLRKRTALQYALEPLVGAFWASFREQ